MKETKLTERVVEVIPKQVGRSKCACLPVGRDCGVRIAEFKDKNCRTEGVSHSVREQSA